MQDVSMEHEKLNVKEVFDKLKSSENGLTEKEAEKRLKKYGFNELKEKRKVTPFKVLLRQFANFIIYVLLAAAAISFFIGEIFSFWFISFIIGFVIILGFIQEYKAEKTMEALKKIVQPTTKVLRNGKVREILTKEVVPGDILLLEMGDKIPADAKIFEVIGLKVDEAALTGESAAVEKSKSDLIYAGTQIVHGKCKALVTATGMQTKLGKIAEMIQEAEEKTPLQIKIAQLAKTLTIIALTVCALTFALGLFKGGSIAEILIIAVTLAVATVPEGLPLALTLTLAYGMHRTAKHNAVIRKMLGVETLGSVTVIATDKTGTLTKNEMTVEKIFTDDKIFDVTGVGYEPEGEFFINDEKIDVEREKNLMLLLKSAALCNNAVLEEKNGRWEVIGDPTEASLIVAAAKANLWKDDLEKHYKRIEEIIFTSERKLMTTIHKKGKEKTAFTKGAVEIVLKNCKFIEKNGRTEKLGKDEIVKILKVNRDFASSAFRVLGIAYKKVSEPSILEPEKDLIFLGLVAMRDPPREEVKEAIEICKKAGIKVVMITGDNEETARAIAKKIGLFDKDENKKFDKIKDKKIRRIVEDGTITGSELDELNEKEFESIVEEICIYARIMPEQKLRIVKALKKKGHIVAMTGDGVNDAPALKNSDIGIAMGIKGTDVARESSVMVLQDDNFATIVEAVKQGRTIYENIEKFTCYLISRNYCEVLLILLSIVLLGFEFLPLLALHILFINVIAEEFPAIALGIDLPRKDIMFKQPRKPKQRILTNRNLALVLGLSIFMTLMAFAVFNFANPAVNIERARTMTFTAIIGMVIFNTLNFRSLDESIFKTGFLSNRWMGLAIIATILSTLSIMYVPFLQEIFKLTTLGLVDWIVPLSVAFTTLIFAEIMKVIAKKVT